MNNKKTPTYLQRAKEKITYFLFLF